MRKTAAAILLALCACEQTTKRSAEATQSTRRSMFASLGGEPTVYPLADGGAFLIDSASDPPAVYYLKSDRAVRVVVKPLTHRWAVPRELVGLEPEVYPFVDGTAYLVLNRTVTARDQQRYGDQVEVLHLTGTNAVRVRETSPLASLEELGSANAELASVTLQSHMTRLQRQERAEELKQEREE